MQAIQYFGLSSVFTCKMSEGAIHTLMPGDERISEAVEQHEPRLRSFIRARVPDVLDAEDILQDVFYELARANRLLVPIEHLSGWLYQVARNRITDLFRKQPAGGTSELDAEDGDGLLLAELLPAEDDGPEAIYVRKAALAELEQALSELPSEQRAVFVAHEVEGRSFNEMVAETGASLNTLLSRKRYAVLYLRKRLAHLYSDFGKD
ncbi:MAG: sigma-70 family RNA polymerase sigma factor [Anaerolineales bacterium]|nr:MAG: sigma-70 family RNA polymerase sigma factor [Anaerolineales bacterium]